MRRPSVGHESQDLRSRADGLALHYLVSCRRLASALSTAAPYGGGTCAETARAISRMKFVGNPFAGPKLL
ncbi:hypothetical protein BH23PLA1_BH23PLA1_42450 [soil metagenome]